MYFANPSTPSIRAAMSANMGLCVIDTPAQGNTRPEGVAWCADNGAFSHKWNAETWWAFLTENAHAAAWCCFAALPDVVCDWPATLARSLPWVDAVRGLGYPVALVLQDGATSETVPWDQIDAVFVGGSTAWKLGPEARSLVAEAKLRGLWAHMGRVNSEKRLRYARHIGCDSADGTYLVFGPDANLPNVQAWLRGVNGQGDLFASVPPANADSGATS